MSFRRLAMSSTRRIESFCCRASCHVSSRSFPWGNSLVAADILSMVHQGRFFACFSAKVWNLATDLEPPWHSLTFCSLSFPRSCPSMSTSKPLSQRQGSYDLQHSTTSVFVVDDDNPQYIGLCNHLQITNQHQPTRG